MFRFEDEEEEPVGRFDLSNNSSDDELDSDDEMQALGRFGRTGEDERAMFASSPSRPIGIPTMDRWALSERARSGDGGHSRAQSCPVAPQIGSMPTPSIHLEIIPPLELPAGSLDDQAHSFTQTGKAISMLHDAVAASETEGSDGSDMNMAVGPSAAVSAAVAIGATGAQRISSPAPRRAGRGGGNGGAGDRLYATSCPNFTVFSLDSKPGCVDARCARRARSPPRPSRVAATAPAHHSLPSPRAHGSTPPDRPSAPTHAHAAPQFDVENNIRDRLDEDTTRDADGEAGGGARQDIHAAVREKCVCVDRGRASIRSADTFVVVEKALCAKGFAEETYPVLELK